MALFQNASQKSKNKNNYIAEIKCGRMIFNSATKMVNPESEKGLLFVEKSSEDGMIHLCWKNREKDNKLSDWLCFENDVKVKFITQLPKHRVFFIKFNATNERHFFWMQDAPASVSFEDSATEKSSDKERLRRIDLALNNLSELEKIKKDEKKAAGKDSEADAGLGALGALGGLPKEYQDLLSQDPATAGYLSQLLGQNIGGSTESKTSVDSDAMKTESSKTATTTKDSGKKKGVNFSDLQAAMASAAGGSAAPTERYNLVKTLNPKGLAEIIGKKEVQEKLIQHLPESEKIPKTAEELKKSIGSPQYQQAVSSFQEALESRQLAQVLTQFGLPASAVKAAETGDSKKFAEALEKEYKSEDAPGPSSGTAKKADDAKADQKEKVEESNDKSESTESKKASDEDDKMAVD